LKEFEIKHDKDQMKNFSQLNVSHIKNDKIDARQIALYLTYGFKEINPIVSIKTNTSSSSVRLNGSERLGIYI